MAAGTKSPTSSWQKTQPDSRLVQRGIDGQVFLNSTIQRWSERPRDCFDRSEEEAVHRTRNSHASGPPSRSGSGHGHESVYRSIVRGVLPQGSWTVV